MSSEVMTDNSADEHQTSESDRHLEANKKLAGKFIELTWNQGRFNLARSFVRRDFKYHASLLNRTLDYDVAVQVIEHVRRSMDDFEIIVEDVIAEGSRVVTQSSFCGTLTKPLFGFKPSKNFVSFAAVSVWEIKKGQIYSLTTLLDTADLMRQIHHEGKTLELDLAALEIG